MLLPTPTNTQLLFLVSFIRGQPRVPCSLHMTQTSCHLAQTHLDLSGNTRTQSPIADPTPTAQGMKQVQGHQWNVLFRLPGTVGTPAPSSQHAGSFLSFRSWLKSQSSGEALHDDQPVEILQPRSRPTLSCSIMLFPFTVPVTVLNYVFVCLLVHCPFIKSTD